jgi:hypothetical protein
VYYNKPAEAAFNMEGRQRSIKYLSLMEVLHGIISSNNRIDIAVLEV